MIRKKDSRIILIFINILFAIIAIILPICNLFKYSFFKNGKFIGLYNFKCYIMNEKLFQSIINSIYVASIVSIIGVVMVFIFVYGIKRTNIKFKKVYKFIPIILFSIPTLIHSIGLICIFGKKGLLNTLIFYSIEIYGKLGIVLCDILYVFPVIYSLIYVAFENCDNRLYEVADIMGTSSIKKILTITLPNMKFSLINAFFSSFILVFTDFGAPKVIGGGYNLVSMDIYQQVIGQQNFSMGAVAGVILMIPSIVFLIFEEFICCNYYKIDKTYMLKISDNKIRDIFFQIYNSIIVFLVSFEVCTILFVSLVKNWPYNIQFTLEWYTIKSYGIGIWEIYTNTIVVAIITAIVGSLLAFISAYLVEVYSGFSILRNTMYYINKLPLTIPGLSLGLSYILFFNNVDNPLKCIYGTIAILILVNIVHFFSVPFLSIVGAMKNIDKNFEGVSAMLGLPWYINLIKVILPLSISALVEAFVYYFFNSVITVSAIIFLYTTSTRVMAIEIVNKNDVGELQVCCAIGIIMLITNVVFKCIVNSIITKIKSKRQKNSGKVW
ncbi:ABC transporter permease subunit [Clostridium novyi]|uniref:ABC transporter permease subunit n=1 Tax=Clostridium novyi TaxID=1542 RepID=UPI00068C009F|nr:ABC transporter permease subunit [Clostridium novyi]